MGYIPSYGNTAPYTGMVYHDANKNRSTVDIGANSWQIRPAYYDRNALVQAARKHTFTNIAPSKMIEKNSGKKLECYFYPRLIDDRNKAMVGIDAQGTMYEGGNFYGSSRDISTMLSRMPVLGEAPGDVNRVGISRTIVSGRISLYGFDMELTRDAMLFDSDERFYARSSELLHDAAADLYEDMLTIDLIHNCGTTIYAGSEGSANKVGTMSYSTLQQASMLADKLEISYDTDFVFGSQNTDTKTISNGWLAYTSPAVINMLEMMKHPVNQNETAFVPVQQYGAATNTLPNEAGSIKNFRFIRVPKMPVYGTKGPDISAQPYLSKYAAAWPTSASAGQEIHAILIFDKNAWATIGIKDVNTGASKFTVYAKRPGAESAGFDNKYGLKGYQAICWDYGFIALRPDQMIRILTTIGDPNAAYDATALVENMKKAEKLFQDYINGTYRLTETAIDELGIRPPKALNNPTLEKKETVKKTEDAILNAIEGSVSGNTPASSK